MNWAEVAAETAVEQYGADQNPTELAWLLEQLAAETPETVVEIGSYKGGTLWAWAMLPGPPAVISVDIQQPGELHGAEWIPGDSQHVPTAYHVLLETSPQGVDFLFIDGNHQPAPALTDFFMWWTLVRPGGLIGLHDIAYHQEGPQRIKEAARDWLIGEMIAEPGLRGTALFRKPEMK
jgi:predicted O-methyltransferase YrrM